MIIASVLSVVLYAAALIGDNPDIDNPDSFTTLGGFLRIGSIVSLLIGLFLAVVNLSLDGILFGILATVIVSLFVVYDLLRKTKRMAEGKLSGAGKEYLETKEEIESSPDTVANIHGDVVQNKDQQTRIDRSTTEVDTLDQSTTRVDNSKTVTDQRTQVEDSVINRSDIGSAEPQRESAGVGTDQGHQQPATNNGSGGSRDSRPNWNPATNQTTSDGATHEERQSETTYCPSCGGEVSDDWAACIHCGSVL